MIDLIREEIRDKYPERLKESLDSIHERKYTLYCSKIVKRTILSELRKLMETSWVMYPESFKRGLSPEDIMNFTSIVIPGAGKVTFAERIEEGYKIEKDGE